MNEENKKKANGEGSGLTNVARGKSENIQRNRSKSKDKAEVTCYQCGWNGHKKPNCRYYKAELENTCDQKKMESENEAHNCWRVAAPDLHSLSSLLSFFYIISLPRLFSL